MITIYPGFITACGVGINLNVLTSIFTAAYLLSDSLGREITAKCTDCKKYVFLVSWCYINNDDI